MPNTGITGNKEKGTSIYIYIYFWMNVIMTSHGDVIGLMVNVRGIAHKWPQVQLFSGE